MELKLMKILLIDDDPELREVLSDILKAKGIECVPVSTGTAALARIERQDIDVALIDLKLEDMSGLDVLRGIKERSTNTENILLTGYASQASAIEAINLGAYSYFQKPYDLEQLLVAIRHAGEKKQFAQALRESEQFAHATVDALSAHIAILDESGTIIAVNRAWHIFAESNSPMGSDLNLFEGANYLSVCETSSGPKSEEAAAMRVGIQTVMSGKQKEFSLEYPCHSPDEKRWFNARVTRFPGEGVLQVVVSHENITERKLAEDALRHSEEDLRKAQHFAHIGNWTWDIKSNHLEWSDEMYHIFDVNKQNFSGMLADVVARVIHPDDRAKVEASNLAVMNEGRPTPLEYRVIWRDGSIRTVWAEAGEAVRDEAGTILLLSGTVQDITERKLAETALSESEKKYQILTEVSPVGIFRTNAQGDTTYVNPRWSQISGLPAEEALGDGWWRAVHPADKERLSAGWKKTLLNQTISITEYRFILPDDSIAWVLGLASPEKNIEGKVVGYVGTITDITDRKQAEQAIYLMSDTQKQIVHFDNITDIYQFVGEKIQELVGDAYVSISMLDEQIQAMKIVGLYGFGDLYKKLIHKLKVDPSKLVYALKDMTDDELRIFRSGNLEKVDGGLYTMFTRKVPKSICDMAEKQLRITGIYAMGFVGQGIHYGGLTLLVKHDIAPYKDLIETIMNQASDSIKRIRAEEKTKESEVRYHSLFDDSPISLWEEDFSAVKRHLDTLRKKGIKDFRSYLKSHPQVVTDCAALVQVMDVNNATLELYQAGSKAELLKNLTVIFGNDSYESFLEELANIAEGKTEFIWEGANQTLKGQRLLVNLRWSVAPGHENDFSKVIISIMDITERKQAEEQLRLLYETSQRLNRTLDLTEIYQTICDFMSIVAPNDGLVISSFDPETQLITCRAYWAGNQWLDVSPFPPIPLEVEGKGTQSIVIRTGQPMLVNDYQARIKTTQTSYVVNDRTNEVLNEAPPEEKDITRSALVVPLKTGGKITGVIQVMSYRLNAYTENQMQLLEALSLHISSAGQNALLYSQVQTELNERKRAEENLRVRLIELELLYENGLSLSQILNPREIGQNILELLEQKLDWHHTTIRLYNPQDATLELVAFHQPGLANDAEKRAVEEYFNSQITRVEDGLTGWTVQQSRTIRIGDVTLDPHYVESVPGMHSGLYTPIKLGERIIGAISIESEAENAFSEADERLLNTLANQAASALENARLFEETRQRVKELETLNRISIALRAISKQDEMLAVVLEEALSALDASDGSISLLNNTTGKLHRTIARGWPSEFTEAPIQPGEGIFGSVFASGNPHISRDFASDSLTRPESSGKLPSGWGGACVPIRSSEQTLGVILIAIPAERELSQEQVRLLDTLAEMTGNALQRASLHEQTSHRLHHLEALRVVDRAIAAGSLDQRITLNIVLDQVVSQLGVDAADVLLLNFPLQTLLFAAGQGFHTGMNESASARVSESFAGRAVIERRLVRVEDRETASGNRSFLAFWQNEGFSNYYAVPLITKGQVKGVLEVFRRSPFTPDSEWINFLETLADQTTIAIDNAQLFENLQSANLELTLAYDATIEGWSRAMDLRDKETEGHTQRVTKMATDLARAFGLNDQEILHIRRGALLHDIGKMGVPDHILLKPGTLVDVEWALMQKHPQFAYDMLQPIQYLRESLNIPYCHHEKWDGTGYPQGLKGEQIPLAARIFAIVDVYDALTSDRPYRNAWPKAKALKYIREQSGLQFDPQVVEKFLNMPGNQEG
jgi:PAS domain S-box-containing protein